MFVRNHMIGKVDVVTISQDETLQIALDVMSQHGHDALPVMDGEKLVGLISKQHIYKTFFLSEYPDKQVFLQSSKVHDFMKVNYDFAYDWDILEKAVQTMSTMRMQFLPVINREEKFVGLLTKQRLLDALSNSLGMGKRGTRIEIVLSDTEGRLATLAKIIAKLKINIISFTMVDPHLMGLQTAVMRLDTKELDQVVAAIEEGGFKVMHAFVED